MGQSDGNGNLRAGEDRCGATREATYEQSEDDCGDRGTTKHKARLLRVRSEVTAGRCAMIGMYALHPPVACDDVAWVRQCSYSTPPGACQDCVERREKREEKRRGDTTRGEANVERQTTETPESTEFHGEPARKGERPNTERHGKRRRTPENIRERRGRRTSNVRPRRHGEHGVPRRRRGKANASAPKKRGQHLRTAGRGEHPTSDHGRHGKRRRTPEKRKGETNTQRQNHGDKRARSSTEKRRGKGEKLNTKKGGEHLRTARRGERRTSDHGDTESTEFHGERRGKANDPTQRYRETAENGERRRTAGHGERRGRVDAGPCSPLPVDDVERSSAPTASPGADNPAQDHRPGSPCAVCARRR